jgi:hypothetical protein
MTSRYLYTLLGCLVFAALIFGTETVYCSASDNDPAILLPPFKVEGKFSELLCGARFRYHLPGAKLKELVIRKTPKSWAAAGVAIGDSITKIDEATIDGISLLSLGKLLEAKFKTDPAVGIFEVRSKQTGKIIRIDAHFEKDASNFTIAYP